MKRWSVRIGIVWAAAVLAAVFLWPRGGSWTIDDGVKRIAGENADGLWAERLADGEVRSRLADPSAFPPLQPPFAARETGGFAVGFAPLTRLVMRWSWRAGETICRLLPALAAIALWIGLEAAGIPFAFVLLPLTFYALVPWEHATSWLLAWPAVWTTLQERGRWVARIAAGVLMGLSVMLRPETAVLALVLCLWLAVRGKLRHVVSLALGLGIGGGGILLWHHLTSTQSAWAQVSLNLLGGRGTGVGGWLLNRIETAYGLLLRMDTNGWISTGLIALLTGGVLIARQGEMRSHRRAWLSGLAMAAAAIIVQTYRLWSSPLPPLALMSANSLIATLPWVLVAALPPYFGRSALLPAAITIGVTVLVTPVWEGVHFGPRLLLFALPLLLLDLKTTERFRSRLFSALLVLTAIPAVNSALLAYARADESAQHVRRIEPALGSPVICPTMSLCVDVAPLWRNREFFTAADPRELHRLLIEMRSAGVDTVWLYLDAHDPLYVKAFPEAEPVQPLRMTVVQGRSLYHTFRRGYELATNRADTAWAQVLETEAGRLANENRPAEALLLQRDALSLTPRSARRHHNLALIFFALARKEDARLEALRARELDSTLTEPARLLELMASEAAVP